MLPSKNQNYLNRLTYFLFFAMLFFSLSSFAATPTGSTPPPASQSSASTVASANLSAADMLVNFAKQIPQLTRLVVALAYVMGMYFIIAGVVKLKHMGEMRTQMSHEHSVKGPLLFIVIGALLLYLPSSVQVGMSSFWADPNPYGYLEEKDQWAQFFNTCFMVVQLVGVIAFVRGLVILSHLGGHGGQPGTFGRGMTHIIGGILCINIYQFVHVVMITLGVQSVLGG